MTRKIPKLKEYRSDSVAARERVELPVEDRSAVEALDESLSTILPSAVNQVFPEAANDAVLEKLVRERAFSALEAKLVSCYGSIPDEIKDEVDEMRRSIA